MWNSYPSADYMPRLVEKSPSEKVLAALYTHSPSGLRVLAQECPDVPLIDTLATLERSGKIERRQVGDIPVWALVGAMGG